MMFEHASVSKSAFAFVLEIFTRDPNGIALGFISVSVLAGGTVGAFCRLSSFLAIHIIILTLATGLAFALIVAFARTKATTFTAAFALLVALSVQSGVNVPIPISSITPVLVFRQIRLVNGIMRISTTWPETALPFLQEGLGLAWSCSALGINVRRDVRQRINERHYLLHIGLEVVDRRLQRQQIHLCGDWFLHLAIHEVVDAS